MNQPVRILYVDDYPLDRELVRDALEKEHGGFEVVEAASRADFETALAQGGFDLVLSDFNILGFEGLQVLEAVRATGSSLPVIIVTGTGSEEVAAEAIKRGAADYVIKTPQHIQRLPHTIHAVLEKKQLEDERRQAEEALRESEDKFKYVFDYSIVGKSITLPSGEISVNKAFCEMLGYTREELQNARWQDITHPDDVEPTQRVVDSLLSGEQDSARFSKRYIHKNGSTVWADVSTALRRDEAGKPLYFMTTVSDITERRKAQEALREEEQRLRLAHHAARVGAFDWNMQTDVNIWTPELEAMYGLRPGEFGRTQPAWEQLVHAEDRAHALGLVQRAIETFDPQEGEWRVIWPDSSVHWLSGRFQAFKDQAGKPLRLIGVNIDITERKRTEAQLNEQLDELRRWHQATLGRETRILDLKREVNELLAQAGQPPRYPSAETENQ